jgi:hypothetical protein
MFRKEGFNSGYFIGVGSSTLVALTLAAWVLILGIQGTQKAPEQWVARITALLDTVAHHSAFEPRLLCADPAHARVCQEGVAFYVEDGVFHLALGPSFFKRYPESVCAALIAHTRPLVGGCGDAPWLHYTQKAGEGVTTEVLPTRHP